MSSTKEYKDYVLDRLSFLGNIVCKPMMGEYLLYYNDLLFGGIYDDRLLVKMCENNKKYNMDVVIPYPNAKKMFYIKDVDNIEVLNNIIIDTCNDLK